MRLKFDLNKFEVALIDGEYMTKQRYSFHSIHIKDFKNHHD